jgi:hypothetical protein
LKRIGAAYVLAAVLATGGMFSLSKSFEVPAVAAVEIATDDTSNFQQELPIVVTPEPAQEPAEVTTTVEPVVPIVTKYQEPDLLSIPELGVSATIVVSPLEGDRLVIPSSQYVGNTGGTPLIGTRGTHCWWSSTLLTDRRVHLRLSLPQQWDSLLKRLMVKERFTLIE